MSVTFEIERLGDEAPWTGDGEPPFTLNVNQYNAGWLYQALGIEGDEVWGGVIAAESVLSAALIASAVDAHRRYWAILADIATEAKRLGREVQYG